MTLSEPLKLTAIADPLGDRTSIQTMTVTGLDVPDPDQLRRVTFVEGRWVATPADTGADDELAGEVVVGSTVILNEKRMRVEARPGADPELVDENEGHYGEPPEPEAVAVATRDALQDGLAALDQVRKLALLPEDVDAGAAADAVAAFCAAVAARKPWAGPVGTVQVDAVNTQLFEVAHEVQRFADLVLSAAEALEDANMEVCALIDAARTGVGPDGNPELRFAHFDDEPEPEPEAMGPEMNLVLRTYGRSTKTPATVHKGIRTGKYRVGPQCGTTSDRFDQTDQPVTCKRCLRHGS